MAASPPALWPCFKHKEVAGQTLMGTCHLNLCPTPSKYLTRYPTEDTLLNIPGHSCITFHRHMLARLGNVVYVGVLRTLSTIQTQNVVIRSKEAEMPRAHSLLSRYYIAHGVLQDSTPTGTNSWSLLGTSRSNCAGSLQASPTLCGTSQRVGRGTACSNHNPWKEQARVTAERRALWTRDRYHYWLFKAAEEFWQQVPTYSPWNARGLLRKPATWGHSMWSGDALGVSDRVISVKILSCKLPIALNGCIFFLCLLAYHLNAFLQFF